MHNAHGRIRAVDVLSARASRAVGIDTQIVGVDFHLYVVHFGHDGNRRCRCMNAPAAFGFGHALHAVRAAFIFQAGIRALARNHHRKLLHAAQLREICVQLFGFPAACVGIMGIHSRQLRGKERRFLAAGARTDFNDDVAVVVWILGQEQQLQFALKRFLLRLQLAQLFLGHVAQIRILEHLFRLFHIFQHGFIPAVGGHQLFHIGVLLHESPPSIHIAKRFRLRQTNLNFVISRCERFQFILHVDHEGRSFRYKACARTTRGRPLMS